MPGRRLAAAFAAVVAGVALLGAWTAWNPKNGFVRRPGNRSLSHRIAVPGPGRDQGEHTDGDVSVGAEKRAGSAESARTHARFVRLMTNDGVPVPDAEVVFYDVKGREVARIATDAQGWSRYRGVTPVHTAHPWSYHRKVRVHKREVTIILDLVPFEVEFRDVRTGTPVPGAKAELRIRGSRYRLHALGDRLRTDVAPLRAGANVVWELVYSPPEGTSGPAHVRSDSDGNRISRMAESILAVVPLGPEIRHEIKVVTPDGIAVEGAEVAVWWQNYDGRSPDCVVGRTERMGRIEVRSLPYKGGFGFTAATGTRWGFAAYSRAHSGPCLVKIALMRGSGDFPYGPMQATGEEGEEVVPAEEDWPTGPARITVRCIRANGAPAPGVLVELKGAGWSGSVLADKSGVALFERVRDGERTVRVDDVAFLSPDIAVRPGMTDVTIRENRRRTVVAPGAPPMGWAVSRWVRVENGVQILDLFSDLEGRRRFVSAPVGKLDSLEQE